jgi:hypothetical protein
MRSGLRRYGVFTTFLVVLSVTVALAEPANAGQDKDKGGHASKAVGGGSEQPPGVAGNAHAQAKGHEAKAGEAPADLDEGIPADPVVEPEAASAQQSKPARAKGQAQGGGGSGNSSNDAHHHVIVCHRTGSASNPYVVLNIPWTAWSGAHDPGSSHAHPPLDGRADVLLADPASRRGTKDGFTAADCRGEDPAPPPPPPLSPPSPPSGGGAGGGLGTGASGTGQGQLPFTGFPVLIALLAALGAAVGAAGIARGPGKKGQCL